MRASIFALAVLATVASLPAFAGPAADVVRKFYSNPIADATEPEFRKLFANPAKAQLDGNQKTVESSGELGCIDWSLVVDGQDWDDAQVVRTLKLDETVDGGEAVVVATFTSFDQDLAVEWNLTKVGSAWKVSDMASGAGTWRLSELDCAVAR